VTYGGGGGGGGRDTNSGATSAGGTGGTGGGGAGSGQGNATSGTDGLGGGGGGSGSDGKGGDGGDGIVVIRYKGDAAGTGGTVAAGTGTAAGYTLHTFGTVGAAVLDLSATDVSSRLGSVVSSAVTGSGALSINTIGTIAYIGSATHTGGTDVQAGTFQLGNGGANGSIADSAVSIATGATFAIKRSDAILTLYNNFSGTGTFAKKGVNQVSLQGDFSGLSGAIEIESGVLNLSNGYGTSYAVAAGTSGAGALTKSSDGTVILSGNLTHTGGTTVTRGKLVINGTHDGSITVLKGVGNGMLGGSGTITGDTTIYGFHTPGNSPGIQTFAGNLTYESGSFLQWELGAQATTNSPLVFDQIVVGGNLTFAGPTNLTLNFSTWVGSTVDWSDAFWNSNRSWLLIDVAGTTTGFENLSLYSAALSGNWTDSNGVTFATGLDGAGWSLSLVDNDVYINYTAAIPEPSAYGLILGGLVLAGAAIRRRRAKRA
jgi:autotransporter-associated beta strand protein